MSGPEPWRRRGSACVPSDPAGDSATRELKHLGRRLTARSPRGRGRSGTVVGGNRVVGAAPPPC